MTDILFFSSSSGLGHVTRNFAISQHLRDFSTKFVTGGAAAKYLRKEKANVTEINDSPKLIVENGSLKNTTKWLLKSISHYKDCKRFAELEINKEKPRVIVSDDDYASLDISQKNNLPTILITNILETRFTKGLGSLIEKKSNQAMHDIQEKCKFVILPFEGEDYGNHIHVGPIVRSINYSREELRKKFSFNKKTILVTVGGTDAGKFLIKKTLEVFPKFEEEIDMVLASGPYLKNNPTKNIRDLGFVDNLHEFICAADLVISLAGLSTISESKSCGTPGIFIPIKNHFEQEKNARDEGFSFNDLDRLDTLILEKIDEKRNPRKIEGAKKTAEIITNLL